ncbi:transglutaminase-like domain-containing protein [Palleronia abyssalis]|uniref:Transglutaminase-like domain-containing protein n=1 Tax=Palleronia abyssalis TaxID=1501240 RepID=A0A2R8C0K8_9RHOB|nr:transglutaminase-like domain-containing protein [Palleronia abyssalis]SPJ25912.1 hypothetical protein PAA8504_03764 [Palleronia abyssalis]
MHFSRRAFLGTAAATAIFPKLTHAAYAPAPGDWRRFEITTVFALPTGAAADLWVPLPTLDAALWQRPGDVSWTGTAETVDRVATEKAEFLHAEWPAGDALRELIVTATVATRGRSVDLGAPRDVAPLSAEDRARYTAATDLIPTDGIVKATSDRIVEGARDDLETARRIYDWIVTETARNPETRGCGLGDIGSMLAMGDLTGKCADLNALFVGLARAAGLPARDLYGLRVAPSAFGYTSLGAGSDDVTKAQHCRAEVFLSDFGWVPADPADVRKVMLQEDQGDLPLSHPKVVDAREALLGAWEGNWIAYNDGHDIRLPSDDAGPLPFLMYPEARIGDRRLDPLKPADFSYEITARPI